MNPAQRIAAQLTRQLEAPLAAVLPNAQEHEDKDEQDQPLADYEDNLDNDWGKIGMDDGDEEER
jgi:hypothetical protein